MTGITKYRIELFYSNHFVNPRLEITYFEYLSGAAPVYGMVLMLSQALTFVQMPHGARLLLCEETLKAFNDVIADLVKTKHIGAVFSINLEIGKYVLFCPKPILCG